jgi:hypothetical protein
MKKKQTIDQLRQKWQRSRERAAEETERLSTMKLDIITPISNARWHEPSPARRPRKGWEPSSALILYGIMFGMVVLMAVPILIIFGA